MTGMTIFMAIIIVVIKLTVITLGMMTVIIIMLEMTVLTLGITITVVTVIRLVVRVMMLGMVMTMALDTGM